MEETLNKILAELQSLNSRISDVEEGQRLGFESVNKKFEDVDKKFEGINKKFEDVNEKFEGINKKFEDVNKKFEDVNKKFEGINKKLDAISAQVAHNTEQEIRLNDVISKVAEHDTDIKLMKKFFINQ